MAHPNVAAGLVAPLVTFLIGGPWYSRILFGPAWAKASGIGPAEIEKAKGKHRHPAVVFGTAYLLSVLAVHGLAHLLGPEPDFAHGVHLGFGAGVCLVATTFGINYAFGGKSLALWAIDAGYHVVQFTLFGAVLGAWK